MVTKIKKTWMKTRSFSRGNELSQGTLDSIRFFRIKLHDILAKKIWNVSIKFKIRFLHRFFKYWSEDWEEGRKEDKVGLELSIPFYTRETSFYIRHAIGVPQDMPMVYLRALGISWFQGTVIEPSPAHKISIIKMAQIWSKLLSFIIRSQGQMNRYWFANDTRNIHIVFIFHKNFSLKN